MAFYCRIFSFHLDLTLTSKEKSDFILVKKAAVRVYQAVLR
jgi:hypothetical protein